MSRRPLRRDGMPDTAPMTREQVERMAARMMPHGLARAGFVPVVFASDPVIHGGEYFRFSYSKLCLAGGGK